MPDPKEDITTHPFTYGNFGGKAVRIRPFWSVWLFRDDHKAVLKQSLRLIDNAAAVLKKYTLSLDYGTRSPNLFGIVRTEIPKGNPAVLDYGFSLPVPPIGRPSEAMKAEMKKVHDLTRKAENEENRLIVVFMPLSGHPSGFCVVQPEWLPWVLVDPAKHMAPHSNTLIHEIGHACRLGHQQMNSGGDWTNSKEYEEEKQLYRNVMGWGEYADHLWGWQAETIHNSYWCNGPRPTNWWIHDLSNCNRNGDCSLNW